MKIFAIVTYKGSNYQGWAKQKNAPTIQSSIEDVLSKIFNCEITIYASGRTDAGVHALGQTFHFEVTHLNVNLKRLKYSVNLMLPNDIQIISFKKVGDAFHARYSAKKKIYKYVLSLGEKSPFHFDTSYYPLVKINKSILKKSLKLFVGKHNYQDFTSKEEDENGFIREIYSISIKTIKNTDQIVIRFVGDGFMRYQIRYIVGTCLEIAKGNEKIDFISKHLDSISRHIISYKAAPNGLYLVCVKY